MRIVVVSLLFLLATGISVVAQDAIFLIRHGEKELHGTEPALTPEGRQRAADWAQMLQHVGIDAIITSNALRTRETGGIIAEALGLQHSALPTNDIAGLVDTLEFDHYEDTVLIVAHAETIPRILKSLGVKEDIEIDQSEFANLFVLVEPSSNNPVYLHLQMPER
jgi:phosphohistidine phosphatase SixA